MRERPSERCDACRRALATTSGARLQAGASGNAFSSAAGSGVAMEKMASLDMPKGESLGTKYDMADAQLLGRGKFSTVHRTQRRADGMTVAIKTIQVRSS